MFILSIDQSTVGTKIAVLDEDLEILGRRYRMHNTNTSDEGWVTHDPQEIWTNIVEMIAELCMEHGLTGQNTDRLGISVQTGAFVVWDKMTGKEYTPVIGWQSTFGDEVVRNLTPEQKETIQKETLMEPDGAFVPGKLALLLRKKPELQRALAQGRLCVGTIDTWLVWKLTAGKKYVTEPGNASVSQMMNLHTLQWSDRILSCYQIPGDILPEIISNDGDFGIAKIGELLSVPIRGVLGDSNAAMYYQKCYLKGQMKVTYGTGVSVLVNLGETIPEDPNGIFCVAAWRMNGQVCYCGEGTVFYAGALVSWMQKRLGLFEYPQQTADMAGSLESNGGIYFVPDFEGKEKGYLVGLNLASRKEHIVRAALESIAYQVKDMIDEMEHHMESCCNEIMCDGGLTANSFLMSFQSGLLNRPLFISPVEEASLLGAAAMASGKDFTKKVAVNVCSFMDEDIRNRLMKEWHEAARRSG